MLNILELILVDFILKVDIINKLIAFKSILKIKPKKSPVRKLKVKNDFFKKIIYVKKQIKYNLFRWVGGGRYNNNFLNSYSIKKQNK